MYLINQSINQTLLHDSLCQPSPEIRPEIWGIHANDEYLFYIHGMNLFNIHGMNLFYIHGMNLSNIHGINTDTSMLVLAGFTDTELFRIVL